MGITVLAHPVELRIKWYGKDAWLECCDEQGYAEVCVCLSNLPIEQATAIVDAIERLPAWKARYCLNLMEGNARYEGEPCNEVYFKNELITRTECEAVLGEQV